LFFCAHVSDRISQSINSNRVTVFDGGARGRTEKRRNIGITADVKEANRAKAILIPIGADTGNLGYVGPIFKEGSFEYLPMKEERPSDGNPKYMDLRAKHSKTKLSSFVVPKDRQVQVHYDPKFLKQLLTYGENDVDSEGRLWNVQAGDLILFWASLSPYKASAYRNKSTLQSYQSSNTEKYIIGFFTVKGIRHVLVGRKGQIHFDKRKNKQVGKVDRSAVKDNQHYSEARAKNKGEFVVVQGDPDRSALLEKAVKLTDGKIVTSGGKKRQGWAYKLNETGRKALRGRRYTQGVRVIYENGKKALVRMICRENPMLKSKLRQHL